MKPLNEREVQEKLYGKYHRAGASASSPTSEIETEPTPQLKPQPKAVVKEKRPPTKEKVPQKPKVAAQELFPDLSSPQASEVKPPRQSPARSKNLQPVASDQARFFVVFLLAVGIVLLAVALRSKPIPSKSFSTRSSVVPSSRQTALKQTDAPPTLPEPKRFTIQAIVYVKKDQAELFAQELKEKNLQASIEQETSSKGQPRYLVFVGEFPTAGEAAKSLESFTRSYPELFRGSFVRKR